MRKYDTIPSPCSTTEIRIVNLSPFGLPFLPVLGHTHYSRPGAGTSRHRHEGFIEVLFCRRGDHTSCDCEGREIDFRPGDIFVAQPEASHFLKSYPKGLDMYWLWIKLVGDGKQFPHLSASESRELLHQLRTLPVTFTGGDRIHRAFRNIWGNHDRPVNNALRPVRLRLAVYDLLLELTEAAMKPVQPHVSSLLETLLTEMRNHPERTYPIDELSHRMGVNAVYLNRLFKRATGLPPHAYLTSLRMESAKELLAAGDQTVTAIARRLGYPSPQHFATQFRQETGLSPLAWRQQRQDNRN